MMGLDGRWSAIRITLESQLIGLALILLATFRAWDDVDTSNALAYVFVAGIAVLFVFLLALRWYYETTGSTREEEVSDEPRGDQRLLDRRA